jgi:hypothetical protein
VLASDEIIREADVMLVQLEVPFETTIAAIRVACDHDLAAVGEAVHASQRVNIVETEVGFKQRERFRLMQEKGR